jgi:hypothetical protein
MATTGWTASSPGSSSNGPVRLNQFFTVPTMANRDEVQLTDAERRGLMAQEDRAAFLYQHLQAEIERDRERRRRR